MKIEITEKTTFSSFVCLPVCLSRCFILHIQNNNQLVSGENKSSVHFGAGMA